MLGTVIYPKKVVFGESEIVYIFAQNRGREWVEVGKIKALSSSRTST